MLTQANAFEIPLADGSVHCCVTSPPYWGLRKYAGVQGEEPLGLEATPERHIERMVLIMREVKRVLRDDGVVWFNYGDCYAGGGRGGDINGKSTLVGSQSSQDANKQVGRVEVDMIQGSLVLMPHRVAIALQDDGWIVRNDVVWKKPNPMPESVAGWRWEAASCDCGKPEREAYLAEVMSAKGMGRHRAFYEDGGHNKNWAHPDCPDCHGTGKVAEPKLRRSSWRHTRAHEYVFQLTKQMGYWSNQEAVREDSQANQESRRRETYGRYDAGSAKLKGGDGYKPDYLNVQDGNYRSGRNPRSVMEVPTAPYSGAHYATFPPNLIAPLIRASCPRWACPVCGQGWAPVVERTTIERRSTSGTMTRPPSSNVTAYRPTCEHEHTQEEAVPGIVFDPFVGSGTTVMVAQELLRRGIGMDISRPYLNEQARIRVGMGGGKVSDLPLFGG